MTSGRFWAAVQPTVVSFPVAKSTALDQCRARPAKVVFRYLRTQVPKKEKKVDVDKMYALYCSCMRRNARLTSIVRQLPVLSSVVVSQCRSFILCACEVQTVVGGSDVRDSHGVSVR